MSESAGASERVSTLYVYVRGGGIAETCSVLHILLCRTLLTDWRAYALNLHYILAHLQVLSMPLAEWIVSQPSVARFVQRAHAATPHRWNIGEDTVLGAQSHASVSTYTCSHQLGYGTVYERRQTLFPGVYTH